jgi:hypothetical protein
MNKVKFFLIRSAIKIILALTLVQSLALQVVWAQSSERFTIEYQDFADSDSVSVSNIAGSLSHRFFLDAEGANLLTLSLLFSQFELTDTTLSVPDNNRQLTTFVPEINLLKILDENYSLIVNLRPGFFGDMGGSLADSFRLEGGFLVTRLINENLTVGLGIGRGTNFGRDLIVPVVQFLYFATDKIVLRGLLPVSASAWYVPSQHWEFGLLYRLQGSMYHLGETNIVDAERLGFATAHVGLGTKYNLTGNYFLTAEAGYAAQRRYEWDDQRGTSFNIGQDPFLERELSPVPYLNIGFMQRF